jgi:hypothetical protein
MAWHGEGKEATKERDTNSTHTDTHDAPREFILELCKGSSDEADEAAAQTPKECGSDEIP